MLVFEPPLPWGEGVRGEVNKLKVMRKKIHLPIIIEQDEDNVYIVSCPQFKGCHSQGKTINEAMSNIQEVIEMCLEEEEIF